MGRLLAEEERNSKRRLLKESEENLCESIFLEISGKGDTHESLEVKPSSPGLSYASSQGLKLCVPCRCSE